MIPEKLIERGQYWTDSLTLVSGCSPVSEGCEHCWSAVMASRFDWGKPYAKNGKWTGKVEPNWTALEKLEKRAASTRKLKPRVTQIWNDFWYIHPDVYSHDLMCNPESEWWQFRKACMVAMSHCKDDVFLILTKRPQNICDVLSPPAPVNVWMGVSVESQKYIHRIDQLCHAWPGKKFVSIEPCLGAVDLSEYFTVMTCPDCGAVPVKYWTSQKSCGRCMEQKHLGDARSSPLLNRDPRPALDQVIIGCESGAHRRKPPDMDLYDMVFQCTRAGVPVFLKQWIKNGLFVKMPEVYGQRFSLLVWNKKGDTR